MSDNTTLDKFANFLISSQIKTNIILDLFKEILNKFSRKK